MKYSATVVVVVVIIVLNRQQGCNKTTNCQLIDDGLIQSSKSKLKNIDRCC